MNKILFNFFYWIFNRRYFWEQEAEIDERHAQFDCDSRWYRIVKYTHIEEYSSEFEGGTTVILGKLWIGRISYDDDNGYSYYNSLQNWLNTRKTVLKRTFYKSNRIELALHKLARIKAIRKPMIKIYANYRTRSIS